MLYLIIISIKKKNKTNLKFNLKKLRKTVSLLLLAICFFLIQKLRTAM